MTTFTALLDACVLYPAPLRDLLIEIAQTSLYRARWSSEINKEWVENLLANEPGRSRERLMRTRDLMNEAAAIRSRADVIVTYNLRDFPETILGGHGIEAQHPDEFICNLIRLDS